MAVSAPLPVVFHGNQPVQVPQALSKASAVYVRVDAVRPPLQRPYEGPFPVISRSDKTFCLRRNGKDWIVSVDRLKAAASSFPLTQLHFSPPLDDDDGPPSRSSSSDHGVIGPPTSPVAAGPRPRPLPPTPVALGPVAAAPVAPDLEIAFPDRDFLADARADPVVVGAAPDVAANVSPFRTRSGRVSVPPQRYQA